MIQANVSKIQLNSALGLGEGGDEEIRSERDGCAMASLSYTAACSPKTMTFPSADTINMGAISDEGFLSIALNCRPRRQRAWWLGCWWKGLLDK